MKRWRVVGGLLVLALSAAGVPLYIDFVILTSESRLTHEQFVRMCHARDALPWVYLLLQAGRRTGGFKCTHERAIINVAKIATRLAEKKK
jgi:hypothetical protein